jgi:hypothetical protein
VSFVLVSVKRDDSVLGTAHLGEQEAGSFERRYEAVRILDRPRAKRMVGL